MGVEYNGALPASNTIDVAVAGVDPTLTLAGPAVSPEGPYRLALSATDPGDDTVTHWDVDWGDGSPITTVIGATPTATHTFDGPATPTITATAHDEDGATSDAKTVTINNVAPVIDTATIGTPVIEGTSTAVVVSATDADQLTYELRNAGGATLAQNQSGNFTASVADDGPFTFIVVVTDDDGASTTSTLTGTAVNAVPTVDVSAPASTTEGDLATTSISIADLGDDTATSAVIDWGSGPETVALVNGAGTTSHIYVDGPSAETFTVISVTDEDAAHLIGNTTPIEVTDGAPTFEIVAVDYVPAGTSLALTTTPITDPGTDTITSVDVNWGDGATGLLTVDGLGVATGSHIYADTVDTATIGVRVTNEDGTSNPVSHTVDVGRAPVADDEIVTIAEDTQTDVAVIVGDTDPDDDLVADTVIVTAPPAFGAAFADDGVVTYIPGTNFDGTDTLEYRVCDAEGLCDTGTVDLTVTPLPDAPELVDDVAAVTESASITVDVLDNDNDPDAAPAAIPGDPTNTLTLDAVDTGTTGLAATIGAAGINIDTDGNFEQLADGVTVDQTITYDVSNATGTTTADVVVTITGENDAPVAVTDSRVVGQNQELAIPVLGNDTDVDTGDVLSVVGMATTTAPFTLSGNIITFTATGSYTSLPHGQLVTESVDYTIEDGAGVRSSATLTVTVNGLDDAPVVEGSLIYTPPADFNGADSFTFVMAGAGGASATFTASISVAPQPDAPRVIVDGAAATSSTTDLAFGATPPQLEVIDADGDTWSTTVLSGNLPAGVTLGSDGVFQGTSTAPGTTTATIEVCDATDLCSTFTLKVITAEAPAVMPPPTGLPATGSSVRIITVLGAYVAVFGALLLAGTRRRRRLA